MNQVYSFGVLRFLLYKFLLCIFSFYILSDTGLCDVLYLKNGGNIEGVVSKKGDEYIVAITYGESRFHKSEVLKVEKNVPAVKASDIQEKKINETKKRIKKALNKGGDGPTRTERSRTAQAQPEYMEVPNYGERVELEKYVVKGKITIFDFYSEYCGPCRSVGPRLKKLSSDREDIVVRKVDINRKGVKGIDWQSPVVQQYSIRYVPYFIVYDTKGSLWLQDKKASDQLFKWMK
jgi:thiol-disulfide isomerase/thioredoxin